MNLGNGGIWNLTSTAQPFTGGTSHGGGSVTRRTTADLRGSGLGNPWVNPIVHSCSNNTAGDWTSLEIVVAICQTLLITHLLSAIGRLQRINVSVQKVSLYYKCGNAGYQRAIEERVQLPPGWRAQELPNYGRNDATYLHHIANDYDALACGVLFMKDSSTKQGVKLYKLITHSLHGGRWRFGCPNPASLCTWMTRLDARSFFLKVHHTPHEQNETSARLSQFRSPEEPLGVWTDQFDFGPRAQRRLAQSVRPVCYGGTFLASRRALTSVPQPAWAALSDSLTRRQQVHAPALCIGQRIYLAIYVSMYLCMCVYRCVYYVCMYVMCVL